MQTSQFAQELESRLNTFPAPPAAVLADLFRQTFSHGPKQQALLWALHTHLLARTLAHAREQTTYYGIDRYAAWARPPAGEAPSLSDIPVVEKRHVRERFEDFIARDVHFASATHTSGATGASLSIYKSREELKYLWDYYSRLMAPVLQTDEPKPLILSLPNLYHGAPVRLPSFGKVFVSGVTDDLLIQDAIKVLRRTYHLPGHDSKISIISGLSFQIEFLTSYLIEQGYDPKDFGIRSINVVGNYTSELCRRFLTESWGALLMERYSLTESVGGAIHCLQCGHFHLDPHVIGEVVDPDTETALDEGVGRLLLTQLYPFVQILPLIRYDPGDVVRRERNDCGVTLSFSFLGKAANCVSWRPEGRTEWLIFSADLYEIVSQMPDVGLYENFPAVRSARDRAVGSPSLFHLETSEAEGEPLVIHLSLELRYAPHRFPDRIGELDEALRCGLRTANKTLASRLDEGRVRLETAFVGPGALGDVRVMKI